MSYLQAVGMGAVAGMRSMSAPALVSHQLTDNHSDALDKAGLSFMADPNVAAGLKILAAGEMVADKTPWIPDRTHPVSLVGRATSGALVGAALCAKRGESCEIGGLLGALSALAATYAMYHFRTWASKEWDVPDAVLGVVEDVLVVSAGSCLLGFTSPANDPVEL